MLSDTSRHLEWLHLHREQLRDLTRKAGLIQGKPIFICVHMVYYRNNGTVVQTYAFNATTDKFSAFKVNNLSTTLAKETTPVSAIVQVANSNITLELVNIWIIQLLFNPSIEGGIYRSLLSFVVNIDGGAVTALTDDTAGCDSCDTSNKCNTNTASKCYNVGSSYAGSDPRLFISWIGTDASGNHMLSHTKRLSRFTQYSIGSIYSSVVNSFKWSPLLLHILSIFCFNIVLCLKYNSVAIAKRLPSLNK